MAKVRKEMAYYSTIRHDEIDANMHFMTARLRE